ncbi:MAG: hypothetical protein J6E40_04710 [Lachnospiraceae bacterium]|nr:hypothetical protein [Lachnospiraceae bacterium]
MIGWFATTCPFLISGKSRSDFGDFCFRFQVFLLYATQGEKQARSGIYNWPEILASTYASLGESYAETLRLVRACTGKSYNEVYVVGGGSRNARINQRCADSLGLPVVACDMECSSVGNAAVQIAYFHPEYTISDLRKIMARSLKTRTYVPAGE